MTKIKIRESELKQIIINTIINEGHGVPTGITETADLITNGLIADLNLDRNKKMDTETPFILKGDFVINDFEFEQIKIIIKLNKKYNFGDFLNLSGADNKQTANSITPYMLKNGDYSLENNAITININCDVKYNITNINISKFITQDRPNIRRVITHELKHLFDGIKKPLVLVNKKSEYAAFTARTSHYKEIKPINDLINAIYYNHDFESLVRGSEFYSLLDDYNITKSGFKQFLENSEVYKKLIKYKYLTIDSIEKEIETNYMGSVDALLNNTNMKNVQNMSVKNKLLYLFSIVYFGTQDLKLGVLKDYLTKDTISGISGIIGKNKDYYDNEFLKVRHMDIMGYFNQKQLEINKNADLTIRKLASLYAEIKESRTHDLRVDGENVIYNGKIVKPLSNQVL